MLSSFRLAIASRVAVIVIQFFANWSIPDHDAGVFVSPKPYASNVTICDRIIDTGLGGFRRWDAEYFLHIAEHGYSYENTLAFYPLYPFVVRYATYALRALSPLDVVCADRNQLLLVSIVLNVIFFAKAANTLYGLTLDVFNNNRRVARIAVTLFCFNPASIFFSAPYTESLFCWLCFSVMLNCRRKRFAAAVIPLAASIMCRSNGLINFGFAVFYLVERMRLDLALLIKCALKLVAMSFVAAGSFFIVQIYFYLLYCTEYRAEFAPHIIAYARENNLFAIGDVNRTAVQSTWCHNSIPVSYGYIQSTYWNVGLFNYYKLKQIPNFLLAAPVVFTILSNCGKYFAKNTRVALTFGLVAFDGTTTNQYVFILHAFALAVFCALFVHVQVATRMLASSSPCLYWFVATHAAKHQKSLGEIQWTESRAGKTIVAWFGAYYCIGTILFCNFLPWT